MTLVKLSNPSGGVLVDGTGVGTITNDDTGLRINDVTVIEGNSGTTAATFTARMFTAYLPPIWGYVSLRWLTRKGYI
mgnify:CR=1 FL=1